MKYPLFINRDFMYEGENRDKDITSIHQILDVLYYTDDIHPVARVLLKNGVVYDNVPFNCIGLKPSFNPYRFNQEYPPIPEKYKNKLIRCILLESDLPKPCYVYHPSVKKMLNKPSIYLGNIDCYPLDLNFNMIVLDTSMGIQLFPNKFVKFFVEEDSSYKELFPKNIKRNNYNTEI